MRHSYVVLHHTGHGEPHYDLMIGPSDGPLVTFRLSTWPVVSRMTLDPLPDHRPHYLTYEGPISGDMGSVRRVEAGEALLADVELLRDCQRDVFLGLTAAERDGLPVGRRRRRTFRFSRMDGERPFLEPVANAHQ